MTRLTPSRGVVLTLVLLLAIAGALFVLTRDAQETAQVEGAKADAAVNTLDAICDAGDKAACRLLEQLDAADVAETQDDEIQEPEVQEPERQDPEWQDPESDDREIDQPERQEAELPDAETQDEERDDPETDQPESQDDEVQDSEVDDPDKDDPEQQDEEVQDPEIDDPDPNDPESQDAETDDPDPASPFTFTFVFTVPSDIPGKPGTTYTIVCDSGAGTCKVS